MEIISLSLKISAFILISSCIPILSPEDEQKEIMSWGEA